MGGASLDPWVQASDPCSMMTGESSRAVGSSATDAVDEIVMGGDGLRSICGTCCCNRNGVPKESCELRVVGTDGVRCDAGGGN